MKKTCWHRTIFWTVLLSFAFMLTGKAIACLAPSAMEMSQGKAMDCCMERCRMETTPAAAKKACEESRQAFSLQETLSGSNKSCESLAASLVSDVHALPLFSSLLFEANDRTKQIPNDAAIKRYTPNIPIYTAIQTFLI